MSTPVDSNPRPAAWTQRLVARSRWLLGAGLAAALLTAGLNLYLARDDGTVRYPVATSGTAVLNGATFTLVGLHELAELPGTYASTRPVTGATFVVAEVDADLSSSSYGCLVHLMAGDYSFVNEVGYTPADPSASQLCSAGRTGRMSVAFQVPQRLLGQVDGLRIELPGDTALAEVVLPGRPS